MPTATVNNLFYDIEWLLRTRGLRHASVDANKQPRTFKFKNGTTPAGGKTWVVIELDDVTITAMDEKAFGSIHPHIPDHTRT